MSVASLCNPSTWSHSGDLGQSWKVGTEPTMVISLGTGHPWPTESRLRALLHLLGLPPGSTVMVPGWGRCLSIAPYLPFSERG